MGAAEVAVLPDDLASIVDAECLGGAGKHSRLVEGVEDMDWHGVALLLVADGCHQNYHLAIRGRRFFRAELYSRGGFFWLAIAPCLKNDRVLTVGHTAERGSVACSSGGSHRQLSGLLEAPPSPPPHKGKPRTCRGFR